MWDQLVEVLGRACREVLCEQGCSPGQQEALAGGQREEHPSHPQLEGGQPRLPVARRYHAALPDDETSGAHADRVARGKTSSSHRSTSTARPRSRFLAIRSMPESS
jgi:hypothetical protein